ncbi:methyl-accepting chemotaxis protein [Pyxidicoccus parkwayensis]|uniref:Methyl-accepting chemotaxis protein n=1 Tax=Pyxidicoccus parkwayensis TaxID=2813578 RepID=A0ABX7NJD0_9BACT|nr:methyl-accepting chemotaxis protein [Pyxidicoccus parkwaysis]QSQ18977.1 methyl-accepting chemotaxis protein [Pyxidicoccus parkwaysis]
MSLLRRLTVRLKLMLLTVVILAAFVASHAVQASMLERFRVGGPVYAALASHARTYDTVQALLGELNAARAVLHLMLLPTSADREKQLQGQWEEVAEGVDARFAEALSATDAPDARLYLEDARGTWSGYGKALREQVFSAPHAQRVDSVAAFVDGAPGRRYARMTEQLEAAANSLRLRRSELERSAEASVASTRRALLGAGLVLGLLLWGVSVTVRRTITRPLQALVAAARQVDGGDLSTRFATDAQDELGQLSRVLGHTVARLRELLVSVQQAGLESAAAAEELAAAAEEQNRSVGRQADAVAQASAQAQEIRQTSDLAANQASEVLRSAEAADAVSRSGMEALAGSFKGIQDLHSQFDRMSGCVEDLARRSARVSAVTDLVRELAKQSDMLAINAAIEATRAGEKGLGFKVVATEIRSLADRSVRATADVREQLEATTEAVRAAVEITEQGRTHVQQGLGQVRTGETRLEELTRILQESSSGLRRIATAVEQQHQGVSQIFSAVRELSTTTHDAVNAVDAMRQSAEQLRSVTRRLTGSLSGFRL